MCCVFFLLILPKLHFYSILNLILRFTKEEAEVRKQAFLFVPARYIQTFSPEAAEVRKIALYPNFDDISEVICGLPRRK